MNVWQKQFPFLKFDDDGDCQIELQFDDEVNDVVVHYCCVDGTTIAAGSDPRLEQLEEIQKGLRDVYRMASADEIYRAIHCYRRGIPIHTKLNPNYHPPTKNQMILAEAKLVQDIVEKTKLKESDEKSEIEHSRELHKQLLASTNWCDHILSLAALEYKQIAIAVRDNEFELLNCLREDYELRTVPLFDDSFAALKFINSATVEAKIPPIVVGDLVLTSAHRVAREWEQRVFDTDFTPVAVRELLHDFEGVDFKSIRLRLEPEYTAGLTYICGVGFVRKMVTCPDAFRETSTLRPSLEFRYCYGDWFPSLVGFTQDFFNGEFDASERGLNSTPESQFGSEFRNRGNAKIELLNFEIPTGQFTGLESVTFEPEIPAKKLSVAETVREIIAAYMAAGGTAKQKEKAVAHLIKPTQWSHYRSVKAAAKKLGITQETIKQESTKSN